MLGHLFRRLIATLPGALAQRIPLLVLVACLSGAGLSGWVVYNFQQRSNALSTAEISGDKLLGLIRHGSRLAAMNDTDIFSGPYAMTHSNALQNPLPPHSVLLILQLGQDRLRAAVAFETAPEIPDVLRAGEHQQTATERLEALSHGITRQDTNATLFVFLPDGDVLEISAPGIWVARLSQPLVALTGLFGFAVILSLALFFSLNLAAPFQRLTKHREAPTNSTLLDSSEARQIGDLLQHLNEQFRIERDKKSRSLAAISHDLRTPVTRLRLRSELLEDDTIRAKFEADLNEITVIVDGALDLLSIRSQTEEPHQFSLVSLLESIVNDYRDVGKPVTFSPCSHLELQSAGSVFALATDVTIKSDNACMMAGQPDKLRRAFSNLIDNALKYGGSAAVEAVPLAKNLLQVTVQDNGPGIDPDQIDRMTLPFVRGHRTGAGVGLGLSIASEIIELHGGTMSYVNTDPGFAVIATVARNLQGSGAIGTYTK